MGVLGLGSARIAFKGHYQGKRVGAKKSPRVVMGSSADSPSVISMPPRTRSRVSNGRLFADAAVDGRTGWARRLRDLIMLHITDLGGEEAVSAAERSICRRIATITTELELLEKKFAIANGADAADLDLYVRCSGALRRSALRAT